MPPAVILSITKEPESDDVIKKTSTRIIATVESSEPIGSISNIWNIASGTETIVDVGGLVSDTTYYCRARAIGPQRIRSDWSTSQSASNSHRSIQIRDVAGPPR